MSRSCRPLSPFELVHAVVCETTVLALRISGPLDAQAIQTAWRYVVAANPVLSGRIEFGTAGLELVTDGAPAEPISTGRVDPVEHSTTPVAFGQPVAGLDLTPDGEGGHWVSLFNHHAIADGTLTYFWYRSLWQHYREIIAGATTLDEVAHAVPESPEAVLAGRGVAKLDRSGAERLDGVVVHPFRDPVGRTPGTDPFALHRVVTVFSAEETTALRAAAKSRNATLHGFICAAILFAERELLEPDGPLALGLISPVDIRKWLTPPVGETEGTNIQGHSFAQVTIDLLDDPRSVGVEILRQLHTDLDEGVVLQTCLHIQETVQRWAANDSLEPISVSNMGEFTKLPLPEDLTVQEFHVRGSAHYGVLAGSGPPENLPLSTGRHHSVFSYDGRLNVQTNYPAAVLSAERTRHFANRIRTHLLAMLQAP